MARDGDSAIEARLSHLERRVAAMERLFEREVPKEGIEALMPASGLLERFRLADGGDLDIEALEAP